MQVGNDLCPGIDVPLAVGTRFFDPIEEWGRDENVRLIRIDIDPEQSVAAWRPDVHIVADARAALAELLERVPVANRRRESRETEFAQIKAAEEEALGGSSRRSAPTQRSSATRCRKTASSVST